MEGLRGQFIPKRNYTAIKNDASNPKIQYEFEKRRVTQEVEASISCMNKCNLNFQVAEMNDQETFCMKRCTTKYSESGTLIDKELFLHTFGNPYRN